MNNIKAMERVQFYGIDGFNRPVFKSLDKPRHFYGDTSNLFSYEATEAEVLAKVTVDDLCYFGSRFDCEPYGTAATNLTIVKRGEYIKEQGAASMLIDLSKGVITVTHGTDKNILAQWTANAGDWEKIWQTINALKAVA